tara:strand:+ start:3232 stop:3528 length:297 start_codon:yes stop_codon:yes gene_type:complete
MLSMKNLLKKNKLKIYLEQYKLAFLCSFSVGFLISSIPNIYKMIDNYRIEKLIQKEMQMQIKEKEKKCKDKNSDYTKFLNLGFPKTAISKFNICIKEK